MSLHKNIKLLTWFNFFTEFKLYAPIAIIYFARVSHSFALGGAVFSIAYITSALLDVPTGIFADRIGRKKTMILGAVSAVLYAIFYALGINFWILALGAFFDGVSQAFYSGNNNAMLHNVLAEEGLEHEYHEYFGKLASMFQLALGISGLIGALIANWSFPLIMWLSVLPQIICLFISLQIVDSTRIIERTTTIFEDLHEGIAAFFHNENLRLLSITSIWGFASGETSYQFQAAFYNTVLPVWAIGFAKTFSNVGATIGYYFAGKVIKKFGNFKILFFGEISSKVITLISYIFATPLSPFLMSTTSFFYGTGGTAKGTLMQKEFTDKQRATMSSLNSFGGSLFFGIVAFIVGLFSDKVGPRISLLVLSISSAPIIWLLWLLLKNNKDTKV